MRRTYVRQEDADLKYDALTSPEMLVVAFVIAAALIYLRFKLGSSIGVDELAVLIMP